MAVQASGKAIYDFDDDEGPVVFKRSNQTTKRNQLNSEVNKLSSQRHDGQILSSNGKKDKMVPSTKSKTSPVTVKSPVANSKASSSNAKHSSEVNMSSAAVKVEKVSIKRPFLGNGDSEDSEDDKPLSSRLNKGNSNLATKPVAVPHTSLPSVSTKNLVKKPSEDSDDEVPLSSRFPLKSSSKPFDSDEKKPLASKIQQNGSTSRDKQQKSSTVLSKRPIGKASPLEQSSVKKPKTSDTSTTMKIKQVSVKAEPPKAEDDDDDDDDHIPIAQRIKKSSPSNNKSSSTKQKPAKVVSSAFKKNN